MALAPASVAADEGSPRLADGGGVLARADEVTSVVAEPVYPPSPVRTADGRRHLVYELLVTNANGIAVAIRQVDALDRSSREVLDRRPATSSPRR